MKLSELLADVPVETWNASPDLEITGVSYDSRKTRPGDLFVAMTGYAADVLSAEYLAAVGAAIHIAGLSADDSADVISDVRVTYGAVVLAALDYSV